MTDPGAIERILGETRWKIVGDLCRTPSTAQELANRLGISANAVRVHLDDLENAGLVAFRAERGRVGKPTHVYSLTGVGEFVLSRAYAPMLLSVLGAAKARMNGDFSRLLEEAGQQLAVATAQEGTGVDAGRKFLASLGAATEAMVDGDRVTLRADCCPLAGATRIYEEMCGAMEKAVQTASGLPTRERCARGDRPRCAFELLTRGTL